MSPNNPNRPHPLSQLFEAEFQRARDIIVGIHRPDTSLFFRSIYAKEPDKASLVPFLEVEHAATLTEDTERPPRLAHVEYDIVRLTEHEHIRSVVNLETEQVVSSDSAENLSKPSFTQPEFMLFQDVCLHADMFKEAMAEFTLPDGFSITIDPWPYGGPDELDSPRYMQGLVFARDSSHNNPDANHYAYPIPIIPVLDWVTKKLVRVDRLATGGAEDGLQPHPRSEAPKVLLERNKSADYVPELLDRPLRQDLKPIHISQPEGASFSVHSDGLVEWQKWRFRLSFTPREGAVLHDICYDNRPILYRLSYSELTVPYGDPRPPYHRKQAFDFGDGGAGRAANSLELGYDCLGAIYYLDSFIAAADGSPTPAKSVVCLHEQDNGILWKHTNYRTSRGVVARLRELVVQFVVTLANYEYIFAFKLDLAGGITIETRATGIMSVVPIDEGKSSRYGNVVAPGILAQNHQHIFAVRIDPAVDSYRTGDTQVVVEETHGRKMEPRTNPHGNYYEVQRRVVERAQWIDSEPRLNRILRLENSTKKNEFSGRNVGYKVVAPATQLMLADEESILAKRALFAKHDFWVTGYRDGEFWAAGEFTNQSREEKGGVGDMVARGDWFSSLEPDDGGTQGEAAQRAGHVVWSVFGFTHNPRVEDWPVMPVEIHQMHLRPADFFSSNPALDVPSARNNMSVLVPCCDNGVAKQESNVGAAQGDPLSHLQGTGPDASLQEAGANVK
ncbi:unnamed protein product [Clonostachys byssicola]|uniref:Amine oxidase n=1 Tax=Clonostachys byssicola TaxID=160290 RepID=A0A9N9Y4H0_9HYPO|nr:unnamed protein product [Clonostachys byssicola]